MKMKKETWSILWSWRSQNGPLHRVAKKLERRNEKRKKEEEDLNVHLRRLGPLDLAFPMDPEEAARRELEELRASNLTRERKTPRFSVDL